MIPLERSPHDKHPGSNRLKTVLAPVFDFKKRRGERQEEEFCNLTNQVVKRLLDDIHQHGIVSVFHKKETDDFSAALFSVVLTSPKLPELLVLMAKDDNELDQEQMEAQRRSYGRVRLRLWLQARAAVINADDSRDIAFLQRFDQPTGHFDVSYRRGAGKKARYTEIPSTKEKNEFLREILDTEVDIPKTAWRFGRPYSPGDTRTHPVHEGDIETGITYWVRDIGDQFPALITPKSTATALHLHEIGQNQLA